MTPDSFCHVCFCSPSVRLACTVAGTEPALSTSHMLPRGRAPNDPTPSPPPPRAFPPPQSNSFSQQEVRSSHCKMPLCAQPHDATHEVHGDYAARHLHVTLCEACSACYFCALHARQAHTSSRRACPACPALDLTHSAPAAHPLLGASRDQAGDLTREPPGSSW